MRPMTGALLALTLAAAAAPAGAQQVLPGLFGQPEPGAEAAPDAAAPTQVDETGKAPDGAPAPAAAAYDSKVRSSFASAEAFQGPLDGAWTLSRRGGGDLYAFQLSDRGQGVEGAWRDLARPGATDASGLVDQAEAAGGRLTLRFGGAAATLQSGAGEVWTGDLVQGGRRVAVTMKRTGP